MRTIYFKTRKTNDLYKLKVKQKCINKFKRENKTSLSMVGFELTFINCQPSSQTNFDFANCRSLSAFICLSVRSQN